MLHNSFNPINLASDLQRHAKDTWGKVGMIKANFLLYPSVFDAYTELYAGLSGELGMHNQGVFIIPWGRKGAVRKDFAAECRSGGNSERVYEWCERETAKYA